MKIGYFGFNYGPLGVPGSMKKVLTTCEQAGFESVWTGEHVVCIDPQVPPSPIAPDWPFVDTVAALAFAAAVTSRVGLGSGIILLPQRNPVVLAKELSGVDVLSQGRLLFGVGVGYVRGEFEAIGVPYEERGARTTEHIEAIRTLWTSEAPAFAGRFTNYSGIQQRPFPARRPHPPIIVGGTSRAAYRRTQAQGNGWYGFNQSVEDVSTSLEGLRAAAAEVEREPALGEIEISVTPNAPMTASLMREYEDAGVSRLILLPRGVRGPTLAEREDNARRFIDDTAASLGLG